MFTLARETSRRELIDYSDTDPAYFRFGYNTSGVGGGVPDSNGHRGGAVCLTGAGPYQAKIRLLGGFFFGENIIPSESPEPKRHCLPLFVSLSVIDARCLAGRFVRTSTGHSRIRRAPFYR